MSFLSFALRSVTCWVAFAALLLLFDLGRGADRVKMISDKSVGELIPRNRHRQQFWNSVWQEGLLEYFTHAWALLRLFDKHISYDTFQIVGVGRWDSRVVATQDLEDETLHGVGVEGMPQCDHLVQDAPQRPNIRLLVIGLLLANLGREVIRGTDGCLCTIVSVLEDTGNSKVTNFYLSTLGHEYVLRLQVAVKNFAVVDVFYR